MRRRQLLDQSGLVLPDAVRNSEEIEINDADDDWDLSYFVQTLKYRANARIASARKGLCRQSLSLLMVGAHIFVLL